MVTIIMYSIWVIMGGVWMVELPHMWYYGLIPIIATVSMLTNDFYEVRSLSRRQNYEGLK